MAPIDHMAVKGTNPNEAGYQTMSPPSMMLIGRANAQPRSGRRENIRRTNGQLMACRATSRTTHTSTAHHDRAVKSELHPMLKTEPLFGPICNEA